MLASTFFCFPTYNNRATRQCRTYAQKNSSTEISGLGWTHDHFSALFSAPQSLKAALSELLRAKDLRVLSVVPPWLALVGNNTAWRQHTVLEAWGTGFGHAVIRAGGAPVSPKRKPGLRVGGTYHKEMMVLITTGGFTTICTSSNLL